MARGKVTDRDRGAKRLLHLGKRNNKVRLRVGIQGEAAAQRAIDADGLTVGDLGSIHEFGLGTAPERSFIRNYYDENRGRVKEMMARVAKAEFEGKLTREQGLNLVGLKIVGEIKGRMAEGIPPPLSKNYLPRKLRKYPGATNPLIASGQLRQAITHSVTDKPDES